MDCSPPGSSVHGILQARILEWVAIPFSGYLPDPGIEPGSPALQADSLPSEPPGKPRLEMLALLLMGVGRTAVKKAVVTEDQWGGCWNGGRGIQDEAKVPTWMMRTWNLYGGNWETRRTSWFQREHVYMELLPDDMCLGFPVSCCRCSAEEVGDRWAKYVQFISSYPGSRGDE